MLIKLDSGDYVNTAEIERIYFEKSYWNITDHTLSYSITDGDKNRIVASMLSDDCTTKTVSAPQCVLTDIADFKSHCYSLIMKITEADSDVSEYGQAGANPSDLWIYAHQDDFARAWLAWPNVEVEHDGD